MDNNLFTDGNIQQVMGGMWEAYCGLPTSGQIVVGFISLCILRTVYGFVRGPVWGTTKTIAKVGYRGGKALRSGLAKLAADQPKQLQPEGIPVPTAPPYFTGFWPVSEEDEAEEEGYEEESSLAVQALQPGSRAIVRTVTMYTAGTVESCDGEYVKFREDDCHWIANTGDWEKALQKLSGGDWEFSDSQKHPAGVSTLVNLGAVVDLHVAKH